MAIEKKIKAKKNTQNSLKKEKRKKKRKSLPKFGRKIKGEVTVESIMYSLYPHLRIVKISGNINGVAFNGVYLKEGESLVLFDKDVKLRVCRIRRNRIELEAKRLGERERRSKCKEVIEIEVGETKEIEI